MHAAPPPIVPTPTVFEREPTEGAQTEGKPTERPLTVGSPTVVEGRPTVSDTMLEGEPTVTDGESRFGGPVVIRGLVVCWGLKSPSKCINYSTSKDLYNLN